MIETLLLSKQEQLEIISSKRDHPSCITDYMVISENRQKTVKVFDYQKNGFKTPSFRTASIGILMF